MIGSIYYRNQRGKLIKMFILCVMVIFIVYQFRDIIANMPISEICSRKFRVGDLHVMKLGAIIATNFNVSRDEQMKLIEKTMPNLPKLQYKSNKYVGKGYNNSCARFPTVLDLEYNHLYWQTLHTSNGTFQLFSAYLDTRPKNVVGPTVRILGMVNRPKIIAKGIVTHCQFWFEDKPDPVIVKSYEHRFIWWFGFIHRNIYQPYLISCVLPPEFQYEIPHSVSLVEDQCDNSTNRLRVVYEKFDKKKDFAVCVKGLDYLHKDISTKLVEWIELLNLLGADKIFFYKLHVHPNISKVLDYYEKEGKVHVTPLTLAGGQPNAPHFQHFYLSKRGLEKRLNELIPYNDCLYRNIYKYKYITLLDTDEVIMPLEVNTWKELINKVVQTTKKDPVRANAVYSVANTRFIKTSTNKEIPEYMYMLQHIYRIEKISKMFVKSFFSTEDVMTLHNHYIIDCIEKSKCARYIIPPQEAHLQHYRDFCKINCSKTEDQKYVIDSTIYKFKEPLIARSTKTLRHLGFFGNIGV